MFLFTSLPLKHTRVELYAHVLAIHFHILHGVLDQVARVDQDWVAALRVRRAYSLLFGVEDELEEDPGGIKWGGEGGLAPVQPVRHIR
jgi:hypothetical protein